jgi:hypothetical protein
MIEMIERPKRIPTLVPRLKSLVWADLRMVSRSTMRSAHNAGIKLSRRVLFVIFIMQAG